VISGACCAFLQACGGGGDATEQALDGNHAPTISGTSTAQANAGAAYTFTPQAADSDGDALTFSITNKPAWATFSATTGQLSGTAQAGVAANITISVSDGKATASLAPFTVTVGATASSGSATVSWLPPTTHNDGTALGDLAGYKIRYGVSQGSYDSVISVDNPGLSTYVIDNLTTGTYYFVVTAYDSAGNESDFSNVASKTIS
jgi:hypothetical protein